MNKYLLIILLFIGFAARAQEKIWEGTGCRDRKVTLTAYLPEGEPRAAVVVCPGGSYHWLDVDAEGTKVGQWLAGEGIAAYVLQYRVAGKFEFAAKYRQEASRDPQGSAAVSVRPAVSHDHRQ